VEDTGGTVTGAPTFSLDGGVTLDGSADYLTYNLMGTEFNSDPISIVVEFTPDTAPTDDTIDAFFDTTGGTLYRCIKHNNANSNVIRIYIGNTQLTDIAQATYASYWLTGQRNVLVISGTTGNNNVYLNGTQIMTAEATAWTAKVPTGLYIGALNTGISHFDGTIHSHKVLKAQLTAAEALDYYDHSTYKYMDSATAVYQMRAEDHDPTGNRTLDSSGNGYHLTDTHDPVKLVTHGYYYDGTNDLHSLNNAAFLPSGDFSFITFNRADSIGAVTDHIISVWDGPGNQRSWSLWRATDNLTFSISDDGTTGGGHISYNIMSTLLSAGQNFVAAVVYDYTTDGSSTASTYLNDYQAQVNSAMDGPPHPANADFAVGGSDGVTNVWLGNIYSAFFFDGLLLTQMQIHDAKMRAWKGLNRI